MPLRACKVKEVTLIMRMETENYQSPLPPAVIVHGLAQLACVCAARRPVTVLSAVGAASAWGCLWWQSLLAAANYTGPALLDCAMAPGRAVEALELGLRGIVLAPCPAWADIAALAAQKRAVLLAAAPPALDLRQKQDDRRLLAWLEPPSAR